MKEPIDYNILKKFADGEYSLKDYLFVSEWFENIESEDEIKHAIQNHWEEFKPENWSENKNLSVVFERIKQKIAEAKPVISLKFRVLRFYTRAAAVLLIPLLIYSFYSTFYPKDTQRQESSVEIFSPLGARTRFELPDGTKGWLNSGSSLKYTTDFNENRNVRLTGEAWFDVVHDEKMPFLVHTRSLDIVDLGTKFNVAAYADENVTDVVLQEGKVEINGNNGVFQVSLNPNEKFIFNRKSKKGKIQTVNAEQFSAWKDGLLVFRNEPLSEVLKQVGRWYNVNIILTDKDLAKFRYRATFQEEQVEEVIRLISLTVPIKYTFDNRVTDSNGIYQKRTITINRKKS